MNNQILKLSLIVARIFVGLLYLLMLGLIILFSIVLFSETSPEWLNFDPEGIKYSVLKDSDAVELKLHEIDLRASIFILIKSLADLFVLSLIIRCAMKVLRSLESLQTFKSDNVTTFKKMGNLFTIWFLVDIPGLQHTETGLGVNFELPFLTLLGTLACYILAEIFREGNKLMEDNKLTI